MKCSFCGKQTREVKDDLCFRCYMIRHAIRLEPEMAYEAVDVKHIHTQREYTRFSLRPFFSDILPDWRGKER